MKNTIKWRLKNKMVILPQSSKKYKQMKKVLKCSNSVINLHTFRLHWSKQTEIQWILCTITHDSIDTSTIKYGEESAIRGGGWLMNIYPHRNKPFLLWRKMAWPNHWTAKYIYRNKWSIIKQFRQHFHNMNRLQTIFKICLQVDIMRILLLSKKIMNKNQFGHATNQYTGTV